MSGRRDPLVRTRLPAPLSTVRSRTAHGLTQAAAEGRFRLQVCGDCGKVCYPPRDACPQCLSADLPFREVATGRRGGSARFVSIAVRWRWRICMVG
jgi:hypothetical protein